jgi:acetylglutamate kinase
MSNRAILDAVLKAELIPVLAPVAVGSDGRTYNVNADTFAGAIAGAMTPSASCCSPTCRACSTRTRT